MTQAQLISELKKMSAAEVTKLINKLGDIKRDELAKEYNRREEQITAEHGDDEDLDVYDDLMEELDEWYREQPCWGDLEYVTID